MKALGWIWFALVQLIELVFLLAGLVLLAPLAATRCWITRESKYFPGRQVTAWRGGWFTWAWCNDEDGVTGADFYRARFRDDRLCAYCWSALRNPANNLRFVFKWIGGPFYRWENGKFYAQAGWYPNGFPVLSAGRM